MDTSRVNWQGFYVGDKAANGSSDENSRLQNAICLRLARHNVISRCRSRNGIWPLEKSNVALVGYGGFVVYNWQWTDVVVGLEASYLHGSFGGSLKRQKSS